MTLTNEIVASAERVGFIQFDDTRANAEGWGIFELRPPIHDDEPLQLQAVCNAELGPERFSSDDEAVEFVVGQANAGSTYHFDALRYLAHCSPRELVNFPNIAAAIVKPEGRGAPKAPGK